MRAREKCSNTQCDHCVFKNNTDRFSRYNMRSEGGKRKLEETQNKQCYNSEEKIYSTKKKKKRS